MTAEIKDHKKVSAVRRLLSRQFPKSPGGRLMCAVVCQAISDAFDPRLYTPNPSARPQTINETKSSEASAHRYLCGDMYHANLAGVEPEWIRMVIKRAGFVLEQNKVAA